MCHLVATSRVEVKFNKENTNENKYVNLTLGFSINSVETICYSTRVWTDLARVRVSWT